MLEASNERLGARFRVCESRVPDKSNKQGLKWQQMKTWACQLTVRDARAFIQEPALRLALCGVRQAAMKQSSKGAHSLLVDVPAAEERNQEMTSLGC